MDKGIINSGGAEGADSYFGNIGTALGYKVLQHSFEGHRVDGNGIRVIHSTNELIVANPYLEKANEVLKRRFPTMNNYVNKLLQRNYYQVINSEFIIAIAPLENKQIVKGGTGWAVEMAKQMGKTVYVFDDGQTNWWYVSEGGRFYVASLDFILKCQGKSFAGVGTRHITEKGIQAIKDVLGEKVG